MSAEPETGKLQLSWLRRQWLKVAAVIGDHPFAATAVMAAFVGIFLFYGIRLGGFSHFVESGARWRLETFGGSHRVERSVQMPDVWLSMKHPEYDQLDVTSPTASHFGGSAFRKELREIAELQGQMRFNVLDPRLSHPSHPLHDRFLRLAEAFGQSRHELDVRLWHSVSVLMHLQEELGDHLEVRLISQPSADARDPYFTIGRSAHSYESSDPDRRLDVIVPRPDKPSYTDSFSDPGMIILNRPKNADVVRFSEAFKTMWESATPLDSELQEKFRTHIDG